MNYMNSTTLRKTLVLILAGGQGERLYPLTKDRTKPSVPFAGCYRIIDFTLSNCIHSGLRHIYVLTQYKSQSLNRHIRDGWDILSRELNEFIETVPPQKRIHSQWYEGTSDAIYQNIFLLEQMKPERVLVLSGDHIYRMDYNELIAYHCRKNADATIASYVFPRNQAQSFGVMHVDDNHRVIRFVEKPADPPAIPGKPDCSLVNMGIYVFNTDTLVRSVIEDRKDEHSSFDLGKNVFPRLVQDKSVNIYSYPFNLQREHAYWRDVGHLDSYYQANMDLLDHPEHCDLFDRNWSIMTASDKITVAQINFSTSPDHHISRSYVSHGCRVEGSLSRCVLSPNVIVGRDSQLEGCIVFNDTVIGNRCKIRNTIIDKLARIPDNCRIGYDESLDRKQFMISEGGIIVIPKSMMVEQLG